MHLDKVHHSLRMKCRPIWRSLAPGAPMQDLYRALGVRVLRTAEGYMGRSQELFFSKLLAENTAITRVLEIGFNAGHSSYLFLSARPDITVVSFDLGEHEYTATAKEFIDKKFPGRHTLVIGDSTETVPKYGHEHDGEAFDLVFIDGGHEYEVAAADILNCRPLAKPGGVVVMDDLCQWQDWGIGPVTAWSDAKRSGLVEETCVVQNGKPVERAERKVLSSGVWAVGRYAA